MSNKTVLVFAAHPDDDAIGAGGSIAKHIERGNNVYICYLTSGDAGSLKYTKEELAQIREHESRSAAKIMGVPENNLIFLRQPDGYLTFNQQNLVTLVNLIREKKPHIIYVHHSTDGHQDHRTAFQLVTEAASRADGPWFQECSGQPWSVETILAYEVWTPLSKWMYAENITKQIEKKVAALAEHKSQTADIPYHETIRGLARYRGGMGKEGATYTEVFEIVKASLNLV
jgi:N-acetylglucosamine malate deacetylase 1